MFDIGGWEFLIIIVVALVIIGPKELPGLIKTITGWIRKARELARDFQSGLDDLAREVEVEKISNEIKSGVGLDDVSDVGNSIRRELESTIDPAGEISGSVKETNRLLEDDPLESDDYYLEGMDEEIDEEIATAARLKRGDEAAEPEEAEAASTPAGDAQAEPEAVSESIADSPADDAEKAKAVKGA